MDNRYQENVLKSILERLDSYTGEEYARALVNLALVANPSVLSESIYQQDTSSIVIRRADSSKLLKNSMDSLRSKRRIGSKLGTTSSGLRKRFFGKR